jgi:hypothetical protein
MDDLMQEETNALLPLLRAGIVQGDAGILTISGLLCVRI